MFASKKGGLSRALCVGLACCALVACVSTTTTKVDKDKLVAARVQAGMGYIADRNYSLAQSRLAEAYELAPGSPEVLEALGVLHWKTREPALSEQYFRKALSKSGNAPRIRYNYALFLMSSDRHADAATQLGAAAEDSMYDNRGGALAALGVCQLKLGDEGAAVISLERAAALSPSSPLPYLELADIHYRRGAYTRAWEYFGQFRSVSRQFPRSLLLGIRLASKVANHDAEASFALELKNLYPHSPEYVQYRKEFPR